MSQFLYDGFHPFNFGAILANGFFLCSYVGLQISHSIFRAQKSMLNGFNSVFHYSSSSALTAGFSTGVSVVATPNGGEG